MKNELENLKKEYEKKIKEEYRLVKKFEETNKKELTNFWRGKLDNTFEIITDLEELLKK